MAVRYFHTELFRTHPLFLLASVFDPLKCSSSGNESRVYSLYESIFLLRSYTDSSVILFFLILLLVKPFRFVFNLSILLLL